MNRTRQLLALEQAKLRHAKWFALEVLAHLVFTIATAIVVGAVGLAATMLVLGCD